MFPKGNLDFYGLICLLYSKLLSLSIMKSSILIKCNVIIMIMIMAVVGDKQVFPCFTFRGVATSRWLVTVLARNLCHISTDFNPGDAKGLPSVGHHALPWVKDRLSLSQRKRVVGRSIILHPAWTVSFVLKTIEVSPL